MKISLSLCIAVHFLLFGLVAFSQETKLNKDALAYIDQYKYAAMEEMDRTNIPACITLAQGLLESGFGKSNLALESNNHFGIKCRKDWTGEKVYHDDDAQGECFRKYKDVLSSYKDHSDFLKNSSRYQDLFKHSTKNYKAWAHGLKKAGYATNPRYAHQLIEYIENYNLDQYDMDYWAKVRDSRETMMALNRFDASAAENKDLLAFNKRAASIKMDTLIDRLQYIGLAHREKDSFLLTPAPEISKENLQSVPEVVSREFDDFEMGRKIFINKVPAVCLPKGFSLLEVAQTYDIPLAMLYKYNDMSFQSFQNDFLQRKTIIFLSPKRLKGSQPTHVLREGETIYDVSQLYGIKLNALLKRNRLKKGEEPLANQVIYLQRFNLSKPNINS